MTMSCAPRCDPRMASKLRVCNSRGRHLARFDLLALEARPLESCVIAVVLSFWTRGVFDRRDRFSPRTVSASLGTTLG